MAMFAALKYTPIVTTDDRYDIGAYLDSARQLSQKTICFLNTYSELRSQHWLAKLATNFDQPGVGLVGASGSFQSLSGYDPNIPEFPNPHIRSNAFMIDRELFCAIASGLDLTEKRNAFLFESGPDSMTRQIMRAGLKALIVGKNGRGYAPIWWPFSDTYRQGVQHNLLVADNVTRHFDSMTWSAKHAIAVSTWGKYLEEDSFRRDLPGSRIIREGVHSA
jgi:hypothetical protein